MPRNIAATLAHFGAYVCRALAWVLFILVGVLAFGSILGRTALLEFAMDVTDLLPSSLAGVFVWPTPFDGAFRGDFAIAATILFVADWALVRVSQAVR